MRTLAGGLALMVTLGGAAAQDFQPPPGKTPDAVKLKAIADKTAALAKELRLLRLGGLTDPILPDVEVYHEAAVKIVKHNEFFQPEAADWTLEVLDRGLKRARGVSEKDVGWLRAPNRTVVRGYRSRLDDSVQPYAVTYPEGYADGKKKWRVDVVLHGRDKSLTEVKFIRNHGDRPAPAGLNHVRIDIYGRGNNAYRWAGEADVHEVMANFLELERLAKRDDLIDMRRWVLRGFSMGGAGAWHLGLHRPDPWCVIGPGAGFTTTIGYAPKKAASETMPPWQRACLHIYDAVDYAENVFNLPVVAYSGADDPQIAAARNIETALKEVKFKFDFTHLVAPGLGHKFPPDWQKKAEAEYARRVARGRPDYPERVRFLTWTLRYPQCDWVRVLGLQKHYEKALVDAKKNDDGFEVTTTNVTALRLTAPPKVLHDLTIRIDGQELNARPWGARGAAHSVYLTKREGKWVAVMPQRLITEQARRPQKSPGLQGPIDDAFTAPFLCVRATGRAWHEGTERYAEADLERFRKEWSKYFRGEVPVKDDRDVTAEDIEDRHLILFGDPSSNSLIAQVLDGLPLKWTKAAIELGGSKYESGKHVPVLIYPSPLNPTRYVVLNSGHTFHAADFEGTNALLFPRLGDFAMLRLRGGTDPLAVEVARAGLFDESWQLPRE